MHSKCHSKLGKLEHMVKAKFGADIDAVITAVNVFIRVLESRFNSKRSRITAFLPRSMITTRITAFGVHISDVEICVDELSVELG